MRFLCDETHEPNSFRAPIVRTARVFVLQDAKPLEDLESQYRHVTLDEWCLMPDHLHGILVLTDGAGGSHATTALARASTGVDDTAAGMERKPVGRLGGAFKTVSTKRKNFLRNTRGAVLWQRNFWDHVVRDDADLDRIRRYIRQNASVSL